MRNLTPLLMVMLLYLQTPIRMPIPMPGPVLLDFPGQPAPRLLILRDEEGSFVARNEREPYRKLKLATELRLLLDMLAPGDGD
ncbi:MAG: hypothetical protein KF832_26090 [Caldilineaceae bacterium]|nr:hypothetical protein [Caldilineaceae bacterium]